MEHISTKSRSKRKLVSVMMTSSSSSSDSSMVKKRPKKKYCRRLLLPRGKPVKQIIKVRTPAYQSKVLSFRDRREEMRKSAAGHCQEVLHTRKKSQGIRVAWIPHKKSVLMNPEFDLLLMNNTNGSYLFRTWTAR